MLVIKVTQRTHTYMGNWFFKMVPKSFNGEEKVSRNGIGITEYPHGKINKPQPLPWYLTPINKN